MRLPFITSVAGVLALAALTIAPTVAAPVQYRAFGDAVSLNPQPRPPLEQSKFVDLGDTVSINPQPLPPKDWHRRLILGDSVSINPQPLPPRFFKIFD